MDGDAFLLATMSQLVGITVMLILAAEFWCNSMRCCYSARDLRMPGDILSLSGSLRFWFHLFLFAQIRVNQGFSLT